MQQYKNLSGDSGVAEFEIGNDFVNVRFRKSNTVYVYTTRSAGISHVNEMKRLANMGQGLATYIAQNTRDLYERKE